MMGSRRSRASRSGAVASRSSGAVRLGEVLISRGDVTPQTLEKAIRRQRNDPRRLGELLVELGLTENALFEALGIQFGRPAVDLDAATLDEDAILLLDAAFARARRVIPLGFDESGQLHVATPTPTDDELAGAIVELTGHPVVLELAAPTALQRALDRRYSVLTKVDAAVTRAVGDRVARTPQVAVTPVRADAPVVQIVNLLLTQGLRDRASDIHFEPQADRVRVRFRVDGTLRDVQSLPRDLAAPICSRLKILARMDIVDHHRAQDGQIATEVDGRAIDIRVATMETVWGEKAVLRLLDRSRSLVPLGELGLEQETHATVRRLIASPYGLVVVSGPTGAGKTTTLYAALNELDRNTRNITTIEDPVEYQFENINQIQINRLAGVTFANGLRAILRQDPDVILIGEVRDAETAAIAIQSALTGHLVLCSMHAADCVGAIYRFLDMGVEPYLVSSAVIGVVAQRLVRTTCDRCVGPYHPSPEELAFYREIKGRPQPPFPVRGEGCRRCGGTGYYERSGVFEALEIHDDIRERLANRVTHSELRALAVEQGMRTLQEAGCDAVDEGRTTIAEVMRTVYII